MSRLAPWTHTKRLGWERRRVRTLGSTASGSGFPPALQGRKDLEIPFYKVKHLGQASATGCLAEADDSIDTETAATLGATVFPAGTLVYAKVGAALMLGRVRTLPRPACIDNNMAGLMPDAGVDERFLFWALSQIKFEYLVNPGAVPSLSNRNFLDYPLLIPPRSEQRSIADYLDRQTVQIDSLIAEQERLIELLQERRQALLERCVTQGLEDQVSLKPSTLDWTPCVPEHWTVANIRRFAAMKTGHTPSRSVAEYWVDCDIPWFTLADVWQLRDSTRTYLGEPSSMISKLGLENSAAELLPAGTVVLSRTASVGFTGIMPTAMATSQDYWNWVCGPRLLPEYLVYVFRAMRNEFQALMIGSTHKTIYQPVAAAIRIPVPPLDEQRRVAAHLDEQTSKIDTLIAETKKLIGLARERRSALINAAVTGQIDVRKEVA